MIAPALFAAALAVGACGSDKRPNNNPENDPQPSPTPTANNGTETDPVDSTRHNMNRTTP